ncbi:branched-chain amino acid transport system II carrier protein [Alphaproteobacteria bacterium]|nr:branched-chain amino acid transport system II carrier protein [Alphaproteobacteria bacterium]
MSERNLVFMYGFALFGMFFGAGNLVFPIQIGQVTGDNWLFGGLGLSVTGIILPFLGLFVVKLHKGDYMQFFGGAGSMARSFLPLVMLSLFGSFAGEPRCITVAYGGISQCIPGLSLGVFSFVFCVAMYYVCLKEQRIINLVGKWLTPVLLLFLTALILLSLADAGVPGKCNDSTPMGSFCGGVVTGYQTMDLVAAFFFSKLVFTQIQKKLPPETSDKDVIKLSVKSGAIAIIMLMVVYVGMVFLGSNFSGLVANINPASMLTTVANHTMGDCATLFMGLTIMLACFTTIVALNSIYAQFLHSLLKLGKDKFKLVLFMTTATSFVISLLDFNGIARFLVPILDALYPSTIVLTIVSIFTKEHRQLKTILFYGTLAVVALHKVFA